MPGIKGILMKHEGKKIDKDLTKQILDEIHRLFETQDDNYFCYNCSTCLGRDCPDGMACGECCEIGFYCDECAEKQDFKCFCGRHLN
jgi:hypothetical protein